MPPVPDYWNHLNNINTGLAQYPDPLCPKFVVLYMETLVPFYGIENGNLWLNRCNEV